MTASPGIAHAAGADLYFECRGDGPPLLLIVGGGGDCGYYAELADILASEFTVLTYDRRGNSRSALHGSPQPITMPGQAADAIAVLHAAGLESALIFGNSGGATVALELAAHQPQAANFAIAHEPPVPLVLADPDDYLAIYDEIARLLDADGWEAAFTYFQTRIGRAAPEIIAALLHPENAMPAGPLRDQLIRASKNWEYLTRYEIASFIRYRPDVAAMIGNGRRVALGYGALSADQDAIRMSTTAAGLIGVECAEFPGGHTAPMERPAPFAAVLREVLAGVPG